MIAADYPFLDVFWTMLIFFVWVAWFMLLFRVFGDVFRRHDIGGGAKVLWIVFVILVPFLGVFIYVIAENKGMTERNMQQLQARREANGRVHPVSRRKRRLGGGDREGQAAARQRCHHTVGVRRTQAEGAGLGRAADCALLSGLAWACGAPQR